MANLEHITVGSGEEKELKAKPEPDPVVIAKPESLTESTSPWFKNKWIAETAEDLLRHLLQTLFLLFVVLAGVLVSICVNTVEINNLIKNEFEMTILHLVALVFTICGAVSACYSIVVIAVGSILKNTQHLKASWESFKDSRE